MKFIAAVVAAFLLAIGLAAGSAQAQDQSFKGEVLETRDVDAYTYLRLKTKDGEIWAAVNKSAIKKGAQVTISDAMVMTNFKSKALNKTFDKIVFGTLGGAGAAAGGGGAGQAPHGATATAEVGDVNVPKAQGPDARTVAEIIGKRTELKGKPVTVRGKVVKFTPGVMGKNWIHLRDGSGSAKDDTNDVLVTTSEQTQVGSVIVAKGVVRTDVDLGSGYSYKVLVEEAKLQK
jgi:hypothetical protein